MFLLAQFTIFFFYYIFCVCTNIFVYSTNHFRAINNIKLFKINVTLAQFPTSEMSRELKQALQQALQ